jgi:maleylpyruvate isomerase
VFEQTFVILASWHNGPGARLDGDMDTDFPNLDETVVATARYLGALTELSDEDVRAPSLLPGWTRAHVITHLCRNADALSDVLHGAQAGETRAMYASQESRDAAIEAGANRSASDLRADAVASSGRWVQAANELHSANLENPGLSRPGGEPFPVRRVGMMRRTEVEVHHADLGIGYTAADWPEDFVAALMKRRQRELTASGPAFSWWATDSGGSWSSGDGPEVQGTAADLAWWLLGRGSGEGLTCSASELPELGRWA